MTSIDEIKGWLRIDGDSYAPLALTYMEQLEAKIAELQREIVMDDDEVASLRAKIAELEQRIRKLTAQGAVDTSVLSVIKRDAKIAELEWRVAELAPLVHFKARWDQVRTATLQVHGESIEAVEKQAYALVEENELLKAKIAELEGEITKARESLRDAQRYRFITDPANAAGSWQTNPGVARMWKTINDLKATRTQINEAIDAAMALPQ